MSSRILLVDDATSLIELFGQAITNTLGHQVTVVNSIAQVAQIWDSRRNTEPATFDLAIVDLAFPAEHDTGLSALHEIHLQSPTTLLGILTQGDSWTEAVLRDAWDLLPIKVVMSKSAGLEMQLKQIQSALRKGPTAIDPALRMLLPAERNPWRTPHNFGRLVLHQGHVKMWTALLQTEDVPTYSKVAQCSGLSVNTVKNYRAQLLGELTLHGLRSPGLHEMSEFAQRCRVFLAPFLSSR
jgi:DNA-binding NarL/FixJ family response regulator